MSSGSTTKVRLVWCPRCCVLLPELPSFSVYRCGGCDAILQAKNKKNGVSSAGSDVNDLDSSQGSELGRVSEDKESSNLNDNPPILPYSTELHSDEKIEMDQSSKSGDCDIEQQKGGLDLIINRENGNANRSESEACNAEEDPEGPSVSVEISELAHQKNEEFSTLVVEDHVEVEKNDKSLLSKALNSEAAVSNNEIDSNFRCLNSVNISTLSSSVIIVHEPDSKNTLHQTLEFSPNKEPEQPQEAVHDGVKVESGSSVNAFEEGNEFVINPSSELSGTLVDMSKSRTASSRAYYVGSVSSYDDEMDDRVPDKRHLPSLRKTRKVADLVASEERLRKDKFPVKNTMSRDSDMQPQGMNFISDKLYAIKYPKVDDDEMMLPTRQSNSVRNRMISERDDEYLSKEPLYQEDFMGCYERGSTSNPACDKFHSDSRFHSSNFPVDSEHERRKLLVRMVYELQDQLNKSCNLNRNGNGRVATELLTRKDMRSSMSHKHKSTEDEVCTNLNYHNNSHRYLGGRYRPENGSSPHQQRKFSRVPFSGDATRSHQHLIDNSYSACNCSQDHHCSMQLLPPIFPHTNKRLLGVHPNGFSRYNTYHSSCPSSPPHYYSDFDFPIRSRDTKSDNLRHNKYHHELKNKYLREKHDHSVIRRHFRPVAGGAPIIACYNCLKLLQIPADFLLSERRRWHRLKCGGCSEVLKFSLQNTTHLVPPSNTTSSGAQGRPPPLSEVDEAHNSRAANYHLAGGDHDPASCSNKGDPPSSSLAHFPLQENEDHHKRGISSHDSFEPNNTERNQFALKPSQSKYKNSVIRYESAEASDNMRGADRSNSPLHRLMGYSSPTDVIYGLGPFVTSVLEDT